MQPITPIEPRPVAEVLASTESAGHWGMRADDALNHTASAALVGDAYDEPTPSEAEHYRMGWWWGLVCGGFGTAAVAVLAGAASSLLP